MKKSLTIATAIAAAVMLAGCSTPAAESASGPAPVSTAVSTAPSATPTAAPVEVQVSDPEAPTFGEADRLLLVMSSALDYYGLEVTPEQARTAANYACDQLAAGTPAEQIVALTGEGVPAEANSDLISVVSTSTYCEVR